MFNYERGKTRLWIASIVGIAGKNEAMYYCPAKNDFLIREKPAVVEREKLYQGWKKGTPEYEKRRRKIRQNDMEKIG